MNVLIPTCNKYMHMVEALMVSTRNKPLPAYIGFIILGFKKPKFELDPGWQFVSIGQRDNGPESWGDGLRWFLSNYEDEHFIYGSDDCAITYFNFQLLEFCIRLAKSNKDIGRISLTADRPESKELFLTTEDGLNVYKYKEQIDYRLSLGWSIYNTYFFRTMLKPGMTPWAFEKQSCGPLNIHPYEILTLEPKGAIDAAYFCRRGQGIIEGWDKGYYGHDLTGDLKETVRKILKK